MEAAWLNATGFEASLLRVSIFAFVVAVLLVMNARVVLALFEALVHREMSGRKVLLCSLRIAVVTIVLIAAFSFAG